MCIRDRAGGRDLELSSRPSAAHGQGVGHPGGDESLVFEALQRGVDGADGGVVVRARGDIAAYREAVGIVAESRDGEEDGELEWAEGGCGHVLSCRTNG